MSLEAKSKTFIEVMPPGADPLQRIKENREYLTPDIFIRFFDNEKYAKSFITDGISKWNSFKELRNLDSNRSDSGEGHVTDFYINRELIGQNTDQYWENPLFKMKISDDIMPFDLEPHSMQYMVYCITYYRNYEKINLKDFLSNKLPSIKFSKEDQFAVIILYVDSFMNIIKRKIKDDFSSIVSQSLINYRTLTPFTFLNTPSITHILSKLIYTKNEKYSAENEFRFCFNKPDNTENFLILPLGNLQEISVLVKINASGVFELI